MHIVALLDETAYGAAHGDDVIIGVGGEDHHTLGEGIGALWSQGVVSIGLATWPAGDGVLQLIEHLDVHKTGGAELLHPVSHTVLKIVFGG